MAPWTPEGPRLPAIAVLVFESSQPGGPFGFVSAAPSTRFRVGVIAPRGASAPSGAGGHQCTSPICRFRASGGISRSGVCTGEQPTKTRFLFEGFARPGLRPGVVVAFHGRAVRGRVPARLGPLRSRRGRIAGRPRTPTLYIKVCASEVARVRARGLGRGEPPYASPLFGGFARGVGCRRGRQRSESRSDGSRCAPVAGASRGGAVCEPPIRRFRRRLGVAARSEPRRRRAPLAAGGSGA